MRSHAARRAKLSPLTVIGELLIISGLVVVGYIFWQPWYTTTVVAAEQARISAETVASWQIEGGPVDSGEAEPWDGEVPVAQGVAEPEVFGVLYVPAFDPKFANQIAEGVLDWAVLNPADKGVGRYTTTQMPGEPGNFALAAHRSGPFTTPFRKIMNLRVGDPIFVQTREGWYTYRFRSLEYVLPHENDVLMPFPRLEGRPGQDKILTLTTCHPENLSIDERAIAYAVLDEFQPSSMGPPAELLEYNPDLKGA